MCSGICHPVNLKHGDNEWRSGWDGSRDEDASLKAIVPGTVASSYTR